jgi:hypothetical protein
MFLCSIFLLNLFREEFKIATLYESMLIFISYTKHDCQYLRSQNLTQSV